MAPTRGFPTFSSTLLTPPGGYMRAGFFGEDSGLIVHQATFWQGVESLLLLLGVAVCVLTILWRYLHPVFLFATTLTPASTLSTFWLANRVELIGTAVVFLLISWLQLRQTEAFLRTTQGDE